LLDGNFIFTEKGMLLLKSKNVSQTIKITDN